MPDVISMKTGNLWDRPMRLDCVCGPPLAKKYEVVQHSFQNTLQGLGGYNVVFVYFVRCSPQTAIISPLQN